MKKLTLALLSLMLFLGMGTAFAQVSINLDPKDGEEVQDGTSVTITLDIPEGYSTNGTILFALAESKEAVDAMNLLFDGETYRENHKPVITAGKTVLKVRVGSIDNTTYKTTNIDAYGEYTILQGDIATPVISVISENPLEGNQITRTDMITIRRGQGDTDSERWYTTDGSTPAKGEGTSALFTEALAVSDLVDDDAESLTIKAIAVKDGLTSFVATATYTVVKPKEPELSFYDADGVKYTDQYGKYVALSPMIWSEEPEMYMMYYTIDGETEPDADAYEEQDDPNAGPIYAVSYMGDEMPQIVFTENTTVFKATVLGQFGELSIDRTMTAIPVPDPMVSVEKKDGKLIAKIENFNEDFDAVYYTTDGTDPEYRAGEDGSINKYKNTEGIEIEDGKTIKLVGYAEVGMVPYIGGSNMIELRRPAAPTFEPASGTKVDFGAKLTLTCDDEDAWILYTTDGTEPSEDNDNAFYYSSYRDAQITATTIKAVAVLNGVPSDVVTATYEFNPITATLSLVPMKEDTVGMNVGTGLEFSIDGWEEYPGVAVYYTVDGTTEPTKAAYEAQADKENGAIKKLTVEKGEYESWGETYIQIVRTDGHALAITFKEATRLKAIGYITVADQDVVTPVLDTMLQIKSAAKPTFSLADGTEATLGDKLVIENPNPYPEMPKMPEDWNDVKAWEVYEEAMAEYDAAVADIPATIMYFSFDGTEPTSVAYDGQPAYEYSKWNVFKTQEGQDVTVFFQMDEKGYYLYVPEMLGYNSPADTVRLSGESFTLKAMSVITEGEGGGGGVSPFAAKAMPGGDFAFMYGSDFATADYTVKEKEEPVVETVATPTFSVAAGEVTEGTKVSIACETEGAVIYYTVDNSEPTAESTEYKEAITIDKAMTVKAIAVKGEAKSEVATAAYTVKTANEDEELAGVSVFPNPSNGLFNIELPVAATIEVFASNGVLTQRISANAGVATLNIDRSGIYFLRITGEGRAAIKRVIVR